MQHELRRTEMLMGEEKLMKLQKSKVVVLGLGGVGGSAFEVLVRGGIGKISIVDNDIFTLSNLNRQILSTYGNIGKYKVDAAIERAKEVNKYCVVEGFIDFICDENIERIISKDTDFVVDAIDTVTSKLQVIKYCKTHGIKIISSMGTGNKLDPSKLEVIDVFKTTMDPLAKVMRKELRVLGIDSLKVVASTEKPLVPFVLEEMQSDGPESHIKKRSTPGSTSFVPPAAGILIASEVINILINL